MKEICKQALELGLDLSYKDKVFLTKFVSKNAVIYRSGYQVHTEQKYQFSRLYKNKDDAIDKFVELCK